jgi:hypothetical protein
MAKTKGSDKAVREHLLHLLRGGGAHVSFEAAVARVPVKLRSRKIGGLSLFGLLEHMRLAQWDILEFSRDPAHVSPPFPAGYWPKGKASEASWKKSIESFRHDMKAVEALVSDPKRDLDAPFPHGSGQTLLREALLVADHNAYHLGQFVLLRKLLGAWPKE